MMSCGDGAVRIISGQPLRIQQTITNASNDSNTTTAMSVSVHSSGRIAVAINQSVLIYTPPTDDATSATPSYALTQTVPAHTKTIMHVDWNDQTDMIATASLDGTVAVITSDGRLINRYKHNGAVYSAKWNPLVPTQLITACHDSVVRLFDTNAQSSAGVSASAVAEFKGHTARAFSTSWSPLIPGRVASASDDQTVRVWNTNANIADSIVLRGHTSSVRGLSWNHAIAYILLSGDWDGVIRVWDIRSGTSLSVINAHSTDIYSITSHPSRPFAYFSTSRDGVVRQWSIENTIGAPILIQAALEGVLLPSAVCNVDEALRAGSRVRLSGSIAESIQQKVKVAFPTNELSAARLLFEYLSGQCGVNTLFTLIDSMLNNVSTIGSDILSINDIRNDQLKKAQQLADENVAQYNAAADIYIRLGRIPEYCDLMIKTGQWERALAIAPSHSFDYWQQLAARYAKVKREESLSVSLPWLVASSGCDELLADQLKAKENNAALLTAISDSMAALPRNATIAEGGETQTTAVETSSRDDVPISDGIKASIDAHAATFLQAGYPVLAACAYLSISEVSRAVEVLMRGQQTLLALLLCRLLQLSDFEYVYDTVSYQCETLGLYDSAVKALTFLPGELSTAAISLCVSRYIAPSDEQDALYRRSGLPSTEEFAASVDGLIKENKKYDALIALIASHQYSQAATVGIDLLRETVTSNGQFTTETNIVAIIRALNSIPLTKHSSSSSSSSSSSAVTTSQAIFIQYISLYFAVNNAIHYQYRSLVPYMFESLYSLHTQVTAITPPFNNPLTLQQIKLREAEFLLIDQQISKAQTLLNPLAADNSLTPKLKTAVLAVKKDADAPAGTISTIRTLTDRSIVISPLPTTPSGSCNDIGKKSMISGSTIDASVGAVAVNGDNYISYTEALMWRRCTPFSPAFDSERINVVASQL